MTTAALAKIKCPQALSWHTLAKVCRLCLRTECIQFDIFGETQGAFEDTLGTLSERILRFYDITVGYRMSHTAPG